MRKRWTLALVLVLVLLWMPAAAAQGENILQNGDFAQLSDRRLPQNWDTDAWTQDELYTSFSTRQDAAKGTVAVIENHIANDARFVQTLTVEPDTVYQISGSIWAEDIAGDIGANLSIADTFVYSDSVNDSNGQWVDVSFYVRTGADQNAMTLFARLGGYGSTVTGSAAFADLSVTKAEAPQGAVVQDLTSASSDTSQQQTQGMTLSQALPLLMILMAAVAGLWYGVRRAYLLTAPLPGDDRPQRAVVASVFLLALAVRLIIAVTVYGHSFDISCWKGWSQMAYDEGFAGFYQTGQFADYPPLYIVVLYFVGILRNALGLAYDSSLFLLLVKLPPILGELLAGWLIFKVASRRFRWQPALGFAALFLLNPGILINASAWGQVDSLLGLFMAAFLYMLYKDRWVEAAVTMAAGFLFKPQMIFMAPMVLPCLIGYCRTHPVKRWLLTLGECLLAVGATALVIVLPFTGGRSLTWIVDLYVSTMGSYPYASLNTFNMATIFGGLWASNTSVVLGLTYTAWGTMGIVTAVVLTLVVMFKDHNRRNIFYYGALLLTGIFCLGHGMHERYLFPALILLAFSYAYTGRKSHLLSFLALSVMQFFNMAVVLINEHLPFNATFVTVFSLLQVLLYVVMLWIAFAQAWNRSLSRSAPVLWTQKLFASQEVSPSQETFPKQRWLGTPTPEKPRKGWDHWAIWVLTAVYAVVALCYLGDFKVPQSMWAITGYDESFVVDLGEEAPSVQQLWQYRTLSAAGASIVVEESDDLESWSPVTEIVLDDSAANDVFKWFTDPMATTQRYLRFRFPTPLLRELEFALIDETGAPVQIKGILEINCDDAQGPYRLFDEQDLIPAMPTQMNSTYFDEIYHARTAWEHANGMAPYEITHPPLGKVIIMLGIEIFGMTPFGWRVAGAVFGIFMVPLLYALAKLLLKNGKLAFVAAFMMCWDFMHFVQTRIATIDVFAVFFILCMYYFMARYLALSHPEANPKKRAAMLALSGLFFGLGAATKWTCIYAGAGLAVIFFIDLFLGMANFARARKQEAPPAWTKDYIRGVVLRLLWCVVFFILVPLAIYVASYTPYMLDGKFDLQVVLDNQRYMINYHTHLVDDHFFKSPWYEWPLIIKPIWFYMNNYLPQGQMASIASFGNPAVWWLGLAGMVVLAFKVLRQRCRDWRTWFIVVGFLAQFLPWVLVPRSTFIYHYFASVPFIILATAMIMGDIAARRPAMKWAIAAYLAVVVILFAVFYPVLSGLPISSAYGEKLKWMDTWYFTY